MDASMLPPPPPTVLEASAGVFDMADAPPAAAAASAAPRDPLGPQNGPAIIGGWTLPAPPPKKAAPPPRRRRRPPPRRPSRSTASTSRTTRPSPRRSRPRPPRAASASSSCPRRRLRRGRRRAGGRHAPRRGRGRRGRAAERPARRPRRDVRGLTVSAATCARGRAVALKRCLVSNAGDTGVASEAASLKLEHCVVDGCEDGVVVTRGSASVVDTAIRNCDCDGIFSVPKIQLLQDVTFDAIGRHEVNCKAGVVKTVGAAPPKRPRRAPLAWEGAGSTPRA
ncbi:hypothetical protein JL722_4465 [Aureococcus anophagefferens]|nr:hypothetical protein JL722_4465 [Aureococcus anophagefferens]